MIFFFLFVLGAIVGSFLNVIIFRFNTGASFVYGRSKCFSCAKSLSWRELLPIFSFFVLRGRCKSCGSKISCQYLFVELATAFLFALNGPSVFSLCIISFLVVIFVYDIRHKIIPDVFSYGVATVSLLYVLFLIFSHNDSSLRLLAGPISALPFFFFWLVSRGKWMGLGDAKLMLSLGWWLGLSGAFAAIFVAIFSGAIYGLHVLLIEKVRQGKVVFSRHEIPFAPFIIIGAFAAYFFHLGVSSLIFLGV